MTISTTELCQLVERPYAWFETKRRRNRAEAELKSVAKDADWLSARTDADKLDLPVKDIFGGAWAKYDLADALNLAATCALEDQGVSFLASSRMVTNSGATEALQRGEDAADFFIAKFGCADGSTVHASGTIEEVRGRADEERPFAMLLLNVSHVLRGLLHRADALGIAARLKLDA